MENKKKIQLFYRMILYVLGLWLMAFGAAFSINAQLGIAPKSSFSFVLSLILKTKMGYCVIAVSVIHLVLQILILRKDFSRKNLLQIIPSILFGFLIDLSRQIIGDFVLPTYFGQLVLLISGGLLVGIGVTLYISARFVPLTAEGLCLVISQKYHFAFHNVKNIQDILSVMLAAACSYIFLDELTGIREGTIILALLIGRFVKYARLLILPVINRYVYQEN